MFNAGKNAALYVNFEGRLFSAPKDAVTVADVQAIAALNEYFLGIMKPCVRLLQRIANNECGFQDASNAFVRRMEELRGQMPNDLEGAMNIAFNEMKDTVLATVSPNGR